MLTREEQEYTIFKEVGPLKTVHTKTVFVKYFILTLTQMYVVNTIRPLVVHPTVIIINRINVMKQNYEH